MEKEKEIINWLKLNNQTDSSFSQKEYETGLELFLLNSRNRVLNKNLSARNTSSWHKAKLFYELTCILNNHIKANNIVAIAETKVLKSKEKKGIGIPSKPAKEKPKVTNIKEALKPDNLVKLQAKGGQLFAKSAKAQRELAEKYFHRDSITEEERLENEPICQEIVADMNEDISIQQEIDHYNKTGQVLGNHPDLANGVDYSVLSDEQLRKDIKTIMSNISNYRAKFKKAKGEKKMEFKLKIEEREQKKEALIKERDSRKQNSIQKN